MNTRQEQLLKYVIDTHVETGEPVGSTRLVAGYRLDVSPATVRHDLLVLEAEGYLTHPHTSAGRVPTAAGYRYYVNHLQFLPELSREEHTSLRRALAHEEEQKPKELAKTLANLTHQIVIVATDGDTLYYTGIKNLFAQPEFAETEHIRAMSEFLDNLDACFNQLSDQMNGEVRAHIGSEGAFGENCSTISVRIAPVTYVLLGPMRMRYDHHMALLKELQKIF
ncbi:MAG: DeoR family transcriptional regulator [Candidatus Magasanikbacteria bacterium]|nr:DeoR family transcriptional regulator [Candidatus Magasanikbacteria bacterium]